MADPTPAPTDNLADQPTLVSMRQAAEMTSLSRAAINRRRFDGTFPRAVSLDGRRVAFVRAEVQQWIADRIARRG